MNPPPAARTAGNSELLPGDRRQALLLAVGEIAERVIEKNMGDEAFREVLCTLGRAANLSRAHLCETRQAPDGVHFVRAHGWSHVTSDAGAGFLDLAQRSAALWQRWTGRLTTDMIIEGDAETFPPEERAHLEACGIQWLAILPIVRKSGLWGFLALEKSVREPGWPGGSLADLRRVARLVGASLDRCELCKRQQTIEANYHALLDNLSEVIFKTDERGNFTYLNGAWRTLVGTEPGEALGRFCGNFATPDDRKQNRRALLLLLRGKLPEHRCEVQLQRADGDTRWVQVSARELELPGARNRGLVGTIVDISAIKKAEGELRAAKAEAEAANRAKSEFLSTMSHELRTPLNAVIGLSESLLETEPEKDVARTRRFLELIHGAGQQLFRQVSDILDLARIEAGRLKLNLAPVEVGSLCATICESTRKSADEKSIRLVLDRPSTPLLIQADERLIGQALHNLVVNAVKFTPSGGTVTISAGAHASGGARVSIADTGIGIPAEKLHLLFKPFTQVDSSLSRRFGGTGLGLVLVDKYVRLHGGSIAVESQPVFGSTFTVLLPEAGAETGGAGLARREDLS